MADYFSHAYGEDYREVVAFLEKMTECFDHKYFAAENSADEKVGKYYNPAMAEKLRAAKKAIAEFAPFVEAHKNMPKRAQTVSYRILRRYLEYLMGLADIAILRSMGAGKEARELYNKFMLDFGKFEIELERYFDICIFGKAIEWRFLKKDEEPVNLGV